MKEFHWHIGGEDRRAHPFEYEEGFTGLFTGNTTGFPSPAEQYRGVPLDLNKLLVKRPAATFFFTIGSDALRGIGIGKGDIAVLDRSLHPKEGLIAVCRVENDFLVRRLGFSEGKTWLTAHHPHFPDIEISGFTEFRVEGIVTAIIKRLPI